MKTVANSTTGFLFAIVAIPVAVLSMLAADRTLPYDIDPFTNVLTAQSLAATGSPILNNQEDLADEETWAVFGWVVSSRRGPVSQYPPGTAAFATPFYLLDTGTDTSIVNSTNQPDAAPIEVEVPALWPAAIAGSLAVAIAAGATAVTVATVTASRPWAIAAAGTLVLGTGLWLNGGYQLWQHGVGSMWVALGLLLSSRQQWLPAGLAFGLGIITRPPVAVLAAAIGLWVAIQQKKIRPVILVGVGSGLGLAALLVYNYWLFDAITITGGYTAGNPDEATYTERIIGQDPTFFLENLAGGLFSPGRGLLLWSPFIIVAIFGLRGAWDRAPAWAIAGALGGLALLILQLRLNRYSGGAGFYSYRYPIEAVVASAPMLAVSLKSVAEHRTGLRLVVLSAAAAIGLHTVAIVQELSR